MRRSVALLSGALCLVAFTGCESAQFTGQSGKHAAETIPPNTPAQPTPPAPVPGQRSLAFTCADTTPKSFAASAGDKVTVSGELCPVASGQAAVLFVVDFSGSMGKHRSSNDSAPVPGNDPEVNGTCGRLKAAQAILAQLQSQSQNAFVQLGFVPFAGDVLQSRIVPLTTLDAFSRIVDKDHFCSYVVQDAAKDGVDPQNPGGIDGRSDGVSAATNYQAAFGAAEQLLAQVQGAKTVFFISDGEPTVPGDGNSASNQAVQAAIQAGQQLSQDTQGLTLNGLLLANQELGAKAQDILTQVAGSADRVRLAANADQLASEIVKFPSIDIDPATLVATLALGGGAPAPLTLAGVAKKAGATGVWTWVTAAFDVVFGEDAVLTISARTTGGTPVTTTDTLRATRL